MLFPNKEELALVARYEGEAEVMLANVLRAICVQHNFRPKQLKNRIPDMSQRWWQDFLCPTLPMNRHLHMLAILSWLLQIPMSVFYAKTELGETLLKNTMGIMPAARYACLMSALPFEHFILQILHIPGLKCARTKEIEQKLKDLTKYSDSMFILPKSVNVERFRADYYRSVAISLLGFRAEHRLTIEQVAYVFDVTPEKYKEFENTQNPTNMQARIGLRLKLGFNLSSTVEFAKHMQEYSAFYHARKVQEIREVILNDLTLNVDGKIMIMIREIAHQLYEVHKKLSK